jgi:hypothetical protein
MRQRSSENCEDQSHALPFRSLDESCREAIRATFEHELCSAQIVAAQADRELAHANEQLAFQQQYPRRARQTARVVDLVMIVDEIIS